MSAYDTKKYDIINWNIICNLFQLIKSLEIIRIEYIKKIKDILSDSDTYVRRILPGNWSNDLCYILIRWKNKGFIENSTYWKLTTDGITPKAYLSS